MPNIYPNHAPMPRAFLAWDGTAYRVCSVDAAGQLQVDIIASALPAGAATAANQATMITALQLIDDLRAALDSVGTDEIDVNVEASVLPTGAATQATLATLATEAKLEAVRVLLASLDAKDFATQLTLEALLTELQLKADLAETQPVSAAALPLPTGAAESWKQTTMITALHLIDNLPDALHSVNTDELVVRGEDQLFSFSDRLLDKSSGAPSAADGYRESGAVPADTVWVVTQVCAFDTTTATTAHNYVIFVGGQTYNFYHDVTAFAIAQMSSLATHLYLKTGDVIRVYFAGALAGDTCTLVVHGYIMTKET